MGSLSGLDLDLLVVFDAIMREGSLTRAGKRLGLSQLAVSHAPARLRHALGDELLVRGPDGMSPTSRGERLGRAVREALAPSGWRLARGRTRTVSFFLSSRS